MSLSTYSTTFLRSFFLFVEFSKIKDNRITTPQNLEDCALQTLLTMYYYSSCVRFHSGLLNWYIILYHF